MTAIWATVPLGEVIRRIKNEVLIDDLQTYARLTIKLNGKGIVLRDRVIGQDIGTKRQFLARTGQLVLSKIDARNGAFGILSADCDRAIITGNFWAFDADSSRLLPAYFDYLTKTPLFLDFCIRASEGTTNRRYLQEDRFLRQEICLPPLLAQRRIVARIDELAAKIKEARELRRKVQEEAEMLVSAAMKTHFDFAGSSTVVGDYAKVQGGYAFSSDEYDELGSHQIVRIGNVRDGFLDLSRAPVHWSPGADSRLLKYELSAGDLVISMTGTRNKRDYGFIGKVPMGKKLLLNQRVGRLAIRKEVDPDYLFHFLRSPFFRDRLFPAATGTANQANVGNDDIECVPFAPPQNPSEQRRIVQELDALQAQVGALKKLQAETSAEFDALIPSILDKGFRGEL